ncbi:ergosterol biosynthetic protein 28 homolog [Saccoglossus kowalevskii]|uniref:Probable ergosterol biosynthetic protein 28-like n=1 Tax=Saccoglossus kowalevskii TaxID=10224 RepID=A0ABM0MSQ6_SACKO|nr:PREDICTED: probable ergosterol biosynthetic protein 28-like [Saccoglossus kowalevskii]
MMKANMESILRGWIALVAMMAVGNTVQCFVDERFLANKLYTGAAESVNPLMARLFGVWTLLAAIVRFYGALHITIQPIYNLTLISFILALVHFVLESFVYKSAPMSIGVIAPLLVSGLSVILMVIGYSYIEFDVPRRQIHKTSKKKLM